ncbi:MAG: hypothetical protein ACI8ZM_004125 [Crocinitomix sp.]|jgi:hypothetical protein
MRAVLIFFCVLIVSCSGEQKSDAVNGILETIQKDEIIEATETDNSAIIDEHTYEKDVITIGERIDGPANVRESPDGELIFELDDNAVIQMVDDTGEWVKISIHCYPNKKQLKSGILEKGAVLYSQNHASFGEMFADVIALVMFSDRENSYAYLDGYTHRDNIRPVSIIENDLVTFIDENGRSKAGFQSFIDKYHMQGESAHLDFEGSFLYENWITDPSPGYRINLFFLDDHLKGVFHSRDLNLPNSTTYEMNIFNYRVSFFNDYPEVEQLKFVEYMREWLQGVD